MKKYSYTRNKSNVLRYLSSTLVLMLLALGSVNAQTTAAAYPYTQFNSPYVPISGTRVTAIEADDSYVSNIPIGFNFVFCGQTYTTVSVSSNGWLSFGNPTNSYLSNNTNSNIWPAVMPLWDDLDGRSGSSQASYVTTGVAPNRIFTFEWKDWEWAYYSSQNNISFQVKLFEGGVVDITYKRGTSPPYSPSGATIGIARSASDYQTLNNPTPAATSSSTTFTTNIVDAALDGQVFRYGQIPCSDTPKTEILGPFQACYDRPFTLSLSGVGIISGLTFQWQYSNNGTTWSNYTGPGFNTSSITDSVTAKKWYRCLVTCSNSGITYITNPKSVGVSQFYYCYCINEMTSSAGIDIGNVLLVSDPTGDTLINNGNASPALSNPTATNAYTEHSYNVPPPCLYRDTSYYIGVREINSKSSFEGAHLTVFIDYNRDGKYDTSKASGEKVISKKLDGTNTPAELVSAIFKVPTAASIGITGMRVILSKDTVAFPCGDLNGDGEVEDYIVNICYRPCNGPTNAGIAVSTDTSMCTSYEYVLTDTTYERARSGFRKAWQISADNISWFDVGNSVGKDTLNRIFTGQPLYYRMQVVCPVTDDTTYSQEVFVNAKPGYKCYCYSKATGGNAEDTSDIGGITIGNYSQTDGGAHIKNEFAFRPRTDHTDKTPIEFFTDSVYSFYVFHTLNGIEHGDSKITVFVDFNNNNTYDIPEERIYTGFTSVGSFTLVDKMVIPYNVISDVPTGMRFILNNDVGPNIPSDEACGPYTSGETEDFIVIFRRRFAAGVGTVAELDGFGLYPNPTTGKFHVQFNTEAKVKEVKVNITNVTGQQILTQVYQHDGGTFDKELNLSGQPSGVYFVELQADGKKLVRKLIVD